MDYAKIQILFNNSALYAIKSQMRISMSKAKFLQV